MVHVDDIGPLHQPGKFKVVSMIVFPFGERMKYNTYSGLVIVTRHQHRHIQQAEQAAS
jgi:hypothetical protein